MTKGLGAVVEARLALTRAMAHGAELSHREEDPDDSTPTARTLGGSYDVNMCWLESCTTTKIGILQFSTFPNTLRKVLPE